MNEIQRNLLDDLKTRLEVRVWKMEAEFKTDQKFDEKPGITIKRVHGKFLQSENDIQSSFLRCEYTANGLQKDVDIGGILLMGEASTLHSLLGIDEINFELDQEGALVLTNKSGDILPAKES